MIKFPIYLNSKTPRKWKNNCAFPMQMNEAKSVNKVKSNDKMQMHFKVEETTVKTRNDAI